MTRIRKLVSVVCLALLSTSYLVSNAQTVDPTNQITGNVITNNWQGTTPITGYGGYSGGYMPGYIAGDRAIVFGYNQGTASQSIAIDAALNAAGAPVMLKGYTYSWYFYNSDYNAGTASGTISLKNTQGGTLESYTYNMPMQTVQNWQQMSGSQLFANQYQIGQVSTLDVSFTGKDSRWWAGYYGPAVKDVDIRLMYGVDPCATNPAYSPSCAGFDKVIESANLVPNPNGYAVFGDSINQSFAINKAFEMAGNGLQIHGFKWGYVANANGPYCNSWDMGLFGCWDFRFPRVTTNVNITNSAGASLYNVTRNYENSYNTTSYSYLFPTSQQLGSLGSFNFTASTNDQAYIGSMWTKAIYTPDQCTKDPLSSPTCPGYATAIATQSATTSTSTVTDTTTTTEPVSSPTIVTSSVVTSSPTGDGQQTTTTTTTTLTPSTGTTTTASVSATPTINNPQPKVGEVTSAGSAPKTTVSTNQILAIVRSEQSKVSALESATVSAAITQVQQQNEKTAADAQAVMATSQSTTSSFTSVASTGNGLTFNPSARSNVMSINVLRAPEAFNLNTNQQAFAVLGVNPAVSYSLRQDQDSSRNQNDEFNQNESSKLAGPNNLLTPTQPTFLQQSGVMESRGPTVNRNVKDNDAAGGISIASIAKQPAGFESYMGVMKDASFYTPKEIYRGQQIVDNARAQRLLNGASDRLHREMVDMQYNNKGN